MWGEREVGEAVEDGEAGGDFAGEDAGAVVG